VYRRISEFPRASPKHRLCHRGGRIRHGVFRQALQVRALSPANLDPQQLEFDHADIFPDLASIETQFHHLVRTVPGNGLIVSNGREPSLDRVLQRGCWTTVEHFGTDDGWLIDAESRVTLFAKRKYTALGSAR